MSGSDAVGSQSLAFIVGIKEVLVPITMQQVEAAYDLAADVFDSKLSAESAATRLHDEHEINVNSARDFISQFRQMLHGDVFKRTMSAPAMEYFLPKILKDRGKPAADLALVAVWKHIEYYEAIGKTKLNKLRSVVEHFQANLPGPLDVAVQQAHFYSRVQASLSDTSAARRKRLKNADKTPTVVIATSKVYLRNPDVVAEVLHRADGQCENCKKPAPFLRRSDRSHYLEVHHRRQLAQGGDDSVENAVALCPNCHREKHHGIEA